MPVDKNTQGPDIRIMNYMELDENNLEIPPLNVADFADSV